jgi:ArsR family metal-binding transcriptional regulator|uniref:Fe-S cluster protein n=1 Tax=Desulfobacca acetoxidans TaxID=60893 RepID=A0A7V6A357_9BACT
MLLDRIDTFEIFRPKMDSTKEVLHAIATFPADISPALPYINAELGGWDYDRVNQVLLLKLSDGKWITLHPQKIAIRGIKDFAEAHALLAWIQGQINDIYERRDQITPRYTSQAGLKIMEILKLLPLTNCKACGYATCMAFAAALREGEISLQDCAPLGEEKYREKREKLQTYLESFGWRALDA